MVNPLGWVPSDVADLPHTPAGAFHVVDLGTGGQIPAQVVTDGGGTRVRVIVRDAKKGDSFRARGTEVAVADLGDAKALEQAFAGASGLYVLIPPALGADDMRAEQTTQIDAVAAAVRAAKVPHVVLLSSVGGVAMPTSLKSPDRYNSR